MAVGGAFAGAGYLVKEYAVPAIRHRMFTAVNNDIISVAKEQFKGVWYMRDDMDKTSNLLEAIQKCREDAEKKQLEDEFVREWLLDFKNVVYDVEDVACDSQKMVVGGEDGLGVVARWMVQAKDDLFLLCDIPLSCLRDILPLPVTPRIQISRRLRNINKNLINIKERWHKLASSAGESSGQSNSATTVSSVCPELWEYKDHPMIGRDVMKAEIKEALLKHSRERCSKLLVVGIVGAGGMGKTTLAHSIFSDEDVKKAFEVNKWQYVGERFDIKEIMNEILDRKDDEKLEDPTELHSEMRERFKEKNALVVLDDAWSTDDKEWKLLQSSLSNEGKAHTLIVTARNKTVPRARCVDSGYLEYELVAMPDSECMEVFKSYAFMGNKDAEQRFDGLSYEVVKKLKGIPLAARMMGGFLSKYLKNSDRGKWLNIVKNKELSNTEEGNVVDKITGLSYIHLPQPLRSCFGYCAMFPKGFTFDKEELVQMWIAQGYIHIHEEESIEDIGKDYFEDLCQRSLLQLGNYHSLSNFQHYTMHDLIHDFAEKIFTEGRRQLKASDTVNKLSEKIRHLSIDGGEFEASSLNDYSKLRTLICDDVTFLNSEDVLANQFRYLRVLILNSNSIKKLPDSIQHLKSLRYLDLSKTQIESLPEAICDLSNLQCLIVYKYYEVWPEGMNKLVNLRHLNHPTDIKSIKGIGKLTSLRGYAISLTVLNKDGWRISELKELKHLHGTLAIWGLKHVKSKREAEKARLKDKVYLEKLELRWDLPLRFAQGSDADADADGEAVEGETSSTSQDESSPVLEALSPPPFLTSLRINNYGRVPREPQQLPCWMNHLPPTLVELEFCGHWERLPKLGRLPSLKQLRLWGLRNVRKIGPGFYGGNEIVNTSTSFFPRLEEFALSDMKSLEEWEVPAEDLPTSSNQPFSVFPCLKTMDISRCPKLRTLSSVLPHLTALQKLVIRDCRELAARLQEGGVDRPKIPATTTHVHIIEEGVYL